METCKILGVNVAVTDMDGCVSYLKDNLDKLKGEYVCVCNVHTTVTAYENKEYAEVQNGAALCLPDGKPLSSVQKKRGFKNAARVTGPSLMEEILKISAENGYRHVFYGSTRETLSKMKANMDEKYKGLSDNCLFISPEFTQTACTESDEAIEKINSFNADFIWVGLGAPKQENWMSLHKGRFNAVCIGVGAAFDYFAGNIKRAPGWMQKLSLEWLYRLIQSPRLFKRYWHTNMKFIIKAYFKGL